MVIPSHFLVPLPRGMLLLTPDALSSPQSLGQSQEGQNHKAESGLSEAQPRARSEVRSLCRD